MLYHVKEENDKLVFNYLADSFDGPYKTSYNMKIEEFFNQLKNEIENLHIKELSLNNNCLVCKIVKQRDVDNIASKDESVQDAIVYDLVGEYQSKLNEHKLLRIDDYFDFDDSLMGNIDFKNRLNDLVNYHNQYKELTNQKIDVLEKEEIAISKIVDNAKEIYNACKSNKNDSLNMSKEDIVKAYQLICSSEYIKNLIEKEYSLQNLLLTEGVISGIFMGPLASFLAEKLDYSNHTIIGIVTGVVVPLLCVTGICIKNKKIDAKYEYILQIIKNKLQSNYNLVYDENTNEVVDSASLKKVLN